MAGKPWSAEAKSKQSERMVASNAKRKELYGPTGAPEDAYVSDRTKKWIVEFYHFLLEIDQCLKNEEYFEAYKTAYPEMDCRIEHGKLYFSKSVLDIHKKHGSTASYIWKKMFVCHQQGGYSKETGKGFPSRWYLNEDAVLDYFSAELANRKHGFTVVRAVKVLERFDIKKRQATEWKTEVNVRGYEDVVPVKDSKQVTTSEERKELKVKRAIVKDEATVRNEELKATRMKKFANKEQSL